MAWMEEKHGRIVDNRHGMTTWHRLETYLNVLYTIMSELP
jgi:hypothetical protein